jgi:hypothetical protein
VNIAIVGARSDMRRHDARQRHDSRTIQYVFDGPTRLIAAIPRSDTQSQEHPQRALYRASSRAHGRTRSASTRGSRSGSGARVSPLLMVAAAPPWNSRSPDLE